MFTRTRTINGHDYEYEEHRWREGGKVRSRSIYLGRKRKQLSYDEEQREKERLEQERVDRVVAYALRRVEKEQAKRQAARISEAHNFLDDLAEKREAPVKKDDGGNDGGAGAMPAA